ncbi:helix-turn-helix transcriptional regulator [Halomicrococcus sp. SG-WS-1]|uniref:helix-turn-helix transcriptional regulator n=1 Tax=Halomicrococcus sp. SG-WS-1 TaxID=3439057 RepID=UPI003F79E9EC
MNIRDLEQEIQDASNVLVLAPLTPTGNQACMELIASASPEETNLAAVTYMQPPNQWIDDWRENIGTLPHETEFIHASGMAESESYDETTPKNVTTAVVDPTDPMEIIVPLSEHLEKWTNDDRQPVVAVQTLTVLLEYIDFDTAFRYLHILTHRVQAAGAVGYYQIDPDVHDPETINTLKTLFDTVVEVSDDGTEWTTMPTYDPDASTGDEATDDEATDDEATDQTTASSGPLSSLATMVSDLFSSDGDASTESTTERTETGSDESTTPETDGESRERTTTETTVPENLADEEMLTDEERIRSLLIQYGGRMKQADITAETSWSKSTVSRKLSKMEEADEITRIQVGRGNLVFLNGSEPEASKSPFEA